MSTCPAWTLLDAARFSRIGVLLQKSLGLNLLAGVVCISLASRHFTNLGHSWYASAFWNRLPVPKPCSFLVGAALWSGHFSLPSALTHTGWPLDSDSREGKKKTGRKRAKQMCFFFNSTHLDFANPGNMKLSGVYVMQTIICVVLGFSIFSLYIYL